MTHFEPLSAELKAAYYATDYSFKYGSQLIVIQLNSRNPDLISFLEKEKISNWAYITAWNPYSIPMPDAFNRQQQQHLLEKLKDYDIYKGEGRGHDGKWPGEESYFVADITKGDACVVGRQFCQNAIVVGGDGKEPELVVLLAGIT